MALAMGSIPHCLTASVVNLQSAEKIDHGGGERVRWLSQNHAAQPIPQERGVEIDQEADADPAELQVGQHLRFVDPRQLLD
jgi:hypothetical protein